MSKFFKNIAHLLVMLTPFLLIWWPLQNPEFRWFFRDNFPLSLLFGWLFFSCLQNSIYRGAEFIGDRFAPPEETEILPLPAPDSFEASRAEFVLRSHNAALRPWAIFCGTIGAVCVLAYAAVCAVAQTAGNAAPALALGVQFGVLALAFALLLAWHSLPLGRVVGARIKPIWRRAFEWDEVARIEKRRAFSFIHSEESRVLRFLDARGQPLWIVPLDRADKGDLDRLLALLRGKDYGKSALISGA